MSNQDTPRQITLHLAPDGIGCRLEIDGQEVQHVYEARIHAAVGLPTTLTMWGYETNEEGQLIMDEERNLKRVQSTIEGGEITVHSEVASDTEAMEALRSQGE